MSNVLDDETDNYTWILREFEKGWKQIQGFWLRLEGEDDDAWILREPEKGWEEIYGDDWEYAHEPEEDDFNYRRSLDDAWRSEEVYLEHDDCDVPPNPYLEYNDDRFAVLLDLSFRHDDDGYAIPPDLYLECDDDDDDYDVPPDGLSARDDDVLSSDYWRSLDDSRLPSDTFIEYDEYDLVPDPISDDVHDKLGAPETGDAHERTPESIVGPAAVVFEAACLDDVDRHELLEPTASHRYAGASYDAPARLVIFDVPSADVLHTMLQHEFPSERFVPATSWTFKEPIDQDGIPTWYWPWSAESLAEHARELLRLLVYPLTAAESRYCVAFPFGMDVFDGQSLDLKSIGRLDIEDIGRLLRADAVTVSLSLLPTLHDRILQTPIEEPLGTALLATDLPARPQIKLGPYRADFLIETRGLRVVVEADGRGFHDPNADQRRDEALRTLGIDAVIRFSGSEIVRDAESCAATVKRYLEAGSFDRGPTISAAATHMLLDPSQRRAAQHRGGPARVLAPAGSGKTHTMVAHIVELVRRGVSPNSILVLAFNKKAADQLQDRLVNLGLPVANRLLASHDSGVVCATFNAFGYRYQREIVGHVMPLEPNQAVWRYQMERALDVVGHTQASMKAKRGSDPVGEFLTALARVRADLQPPDEIGVEIESFGGSDSVIPFGPVLRAFETVQLAAQHQSFNDQIYFAIRDLLAVPAHRRMIQQRFTHVLVDEFQDLNGAQLALVDIITRPHRNLFVVGDDDQLIYGWRFARPTNILDFHERMPPKPYSATYTLSTNYRCSLAVIESSRRLIENNRIREPKDIRPKPDADPGTVSFAVAPTWHERAESIIAFLRLERERTRCRWQELAVLCAYKSQQPLVALALDAAGIPRTSLLTYRLFSHSAARLLHAYLRLVMDPSRVTGDEWALLLNRPNRYLTNAYVQHIAIAADPWSAFTRSVADPDAPHGATSFHQRLLRLHVWYGEQAPDAAALLQHVLVEFGLESYWRDAVRANASQTQDEAGPAQIVEVLAQAARDHPDPAEFMTEWARRAEDEAARLDMADDDLAREKAMDRDQVVIGTIHAAKGREYRSVVIVDYYRDVTWLSPAELEEERRVLYVGVTRAKDAVLLTVDRSRPTVHPFVRELIRPLEPDEERRLRATRDRLHSAETDLFVTAALLRDEIVAIQNGTALAENESVIAALKPQLEAADRRLTELDRLIATGGWRGAWWAISGRIQQLHVERAQVESARASAAVEIAEHEKRALLIRTNPDAAAHNLFRRLCTTEQQLADIRAAQRAHDSRWQEIGILMSR